MVVAVVTTLRDSACTDIEFVYTCTRYTLRVFA